MRADSKPQPPHQAPSPSGRRRRAGRPRFYGAQDLMEVWLAVEEYRARHRCSANKACQQLALTFGVVGPRCIVPDHTISKKTLRSRYQKAVRLLKAEQEERAALILSMRAIGASSTQEHAPLPLAAFLRGQLVYRLQSS